MNEHYLARIHHLVSSALLVGDISVKEDLFEAGYLDSIGIVNILLALEEEFQITLSMEELDLEEFRSIEQIYHLIAPQLNVSV